MAYSSGGQARPEGDFARQGIKLKWPDRDYSSGGQTWPTFNLGSVWCHLLAHAVVGGQGGGGAGLLGGHRLGPGGQFGSKYNI